MIDGDTVGLNDGDTVGLNDGDKFGLSGEYVGLNLVVLVLWLDHAWIHCWIK